ncbi:hypothetical protein CPT03_08445 [Pedobacter ginsengisoli]|uniref:Conjugal transfer protein TraG n=1 Tax=Pedobacter ginsengisoli TaxID=363852 RepID=A0A2D1U4G4_9SPHI|nr:YWFCY domain-containing protein [Pedobacter ginsengisoli]ATP56500.1 hypothetical protein CPT03_08445 [Pedobacter ginsengisoli]
MNTGEDIQGLRKITDFTRLISIFILVIHFYLCCYTAFSQWNLTAEITDRLIANIAKTGLFKGIWKPKLAALLLLVVSLIAVKGKKDEKIQHRTIFAYLLTGLLLYLMSMLCLYLYVPPKIIAVSYIIVTAIGYLLILTSGTYLSRLIRDGLNKDVFNSENETFPQEERLLENEYSINLPATYRLKDKVRDSWINFINPFRGMLVAGTPGAGKSYFVIRHIIDQHIKKGFSMFLYDFKFDDLSKIAYNKLLKYSTNYEVKPKFYIINFDDLNRTHRCNPLDPNAMDDITDATEASRTNMIKLDINEVAQNGDTFFSSQDTAYMVFMLIGIVGYFCVPTVANYVVHAGGGNSILGKVNSMGGGLGNWGSNTGSMAGGLAASGAKRAGIAVGGMVSDAFGDGKRQMGGMAETSGQDYFRDKLQGNSKS